MDVLGKLTGSTLEEKVTEYSEIYGEVLLGLKADLDKLRRVLDDSQKRNLQQSKQIHQLRLLCVISYVFALGVGVLLWISR
jgi:hypothetical protein